jgi:hypothetical protein
MYKTRTPRSKKIMALLFWLLLCLENFRKIAPDSLGRLPPVLKPTSTLHYANEETQPILPRRGTKPLAFCLSSQSLDNLIHPTIGVMKFIGNSDQKSMIHIVNKKNPFDYFIN